MNIVIKDPELLPAKELISRLLNGDVLVSMPLTNRVLIGAYGAPLRERAKVYSSFFKMMNRKGLLLKTYDGHRTIYMLTDEAKAGFRGEN